MPDSVVPPQDASGLRVEDHLLDGPHGALPVRTYSLPAARRGLVWVHGGAFAFGGLDDAESDWVARQLALRGVAVVAVDYRLAPVAAWAAEAMGVPERGGVHFPVASDEVTAAFVWATSSLPQIDAGEWSLGGASAGANLAAGAALRLRDQAAAVPRTLVLAYGLFHAELPPLSDELAAKYRALPPEQAVFTPELVQLINANYSGDTSALTSPYAFPGGHDLTNLPTTLLVNADIDSLRASGDAFAAELVTAGVDVLTVREVGTPHGHLSMPELPAAGRSIDRMALWLTSDLVDPR